MSHSSLTGSSALKKLRPALEALPTHPTKRMGLDASRLSPLLVSISKELTADRETLLKPFNQEVKARLEDILERLPHLIRAFTYVYGLFERAPNAASHLQNLASEALLLRPAAFRNLELMETLGLVSKEEADKIRAGKGYIDLGGDFRSLGTLMKEHWKVLEPLQKYCSDESLRLTVKQVKRISELGDQIGETERSAPDQDSDSIQILRDLMGLELLLQQDWSLLQAIVPASYALAGTPDKANIVRYTLLGLQRQATPSTNSSETTTGASEAPTPEPTPSTPNTTS